MVILRSSRNRFWNEMIKNVERMAHAAREPSVVVDRCNIGPAAIAVSFLWVVATLNAQAQTSTSVTRTFYAVTGLLQTETRDGVTTTYTYYPNGDVETVTDSRGVVSRYSNYKRGIAQTTVHAEGRPEQVSVLREVDDLGCITAESDGEGNRTVYGRDALCRVTLIIPPKAGSSSTTVVYSAYNTTAPETHTLARGDYIESRKFDGFGRLVEKVAGGVKHTWEYDLSGRRKFEAYPVDASVLVPTGDTFAYDALDRVTQMTHADNSFTKYEYQASVTGAPQVKVTDERGNVITHTFRAFGSPETAELIGINTPVASADIALERNVRGQVIKATQGGFTRNYNYDTRYYLSSVVNPETGTTTYGRDALGNMTSVQVGSAGTTYFDLDGLNQVYAIRYPDSSRNVSQTWYKNGKRKSAGNGTSTLSWSYDANRNLTQESLSVGGHEFTTVYGYDSNDAVSSISYPKKGGTLDLAPDVLGRPTKVGSYVTEVSYHPTGLIKSMTYGNQVKTAITPDSRQRPYTMAVGREGGSAYVGLTFNYDDANNMASIADTANSSNNRSFGYDGIDRLTSVTHGGTAYPIAYDGAGNITQQNFGGTLNYTYNTTSNRLTSTSGVKAGSYTYDARGNTSSNGSISFQYDDNSRLRCAKCGTPDEITYNHDALGMRLSRTKSGQTVYQVYGGGGDLLMEFNPATNQRQEHIYLRGQKVATTTQSAYFATTVGLTTSATAITPGQHVTLTATVGGGRTPDGVVNFYDNGVFIGSAAIVNGNATLTTTALNFGYHNFSASYAGDGANAVSSTAVITRVESGQVTAVIMNIINSLLLDD